MSVGADVALESGRVDGGPVGCDGKGVTGGSGGSSQHHDEVAVSNPARAEHVVVLQFASVEDHNLRRRRNVGLRLEDGLSRRVQRDDAMR